MAGSSPAMTMPLSLLPAQHAGKKKPGRFSGSGLSLSVNSLG
jgi:hypothetical protein